MAKLCSLFQVSAETLFGNVPSLIRVHKKFWEEVLGPTLREARASGQPLDPVSLQDGFSTVRHGEGPRLPGQAWESPERTCPQGLPGPLKPICELRESEGTPTPTPRISPHLLPFIPQVPPLSQKLFGLLVTLEMKCSYLSEGFHQIS